jgi:hypothetical protein
MTTVQPQTKEAITSVLVGAFVVLLSLTILSLIYLTYSVKIYRFSSVTCGFCRDSQAEWEDFKQMMKFRFVICYDVDRDASDPNTADLLDNFSVTTVPKVVAVLPDGRRYEYTGERTSTAMNSWVSNL